MNKRPDETEVTQFHIAEEKGCADPKTARAFLERVIGQDISVEEGGREGEKEGKVFTLKVASAQRSRIKRALASMNFAVLNDHLETA
jgi:hypothetical protein